MLTIPHDTGYTETRTSNVTEFRARHDLHLHRENHPAMFFELVLRDSLGSSKRPQDLTEPFAGLLEYLMSVILFRGGGGGGGSVTHNALGSKLSQDAIGQNADLILGYACPTLLPVLSEIAAAVFCMTSSFLQISKLKTGLHVDQYCCCLGDLIVKWKEESEIN